MRIGGVNNMKKYKIAVAGTGYVGLSIATLLSQHHHETAVDIIPEKVEMINNRKSPIQDDYIEKYLAEKELNLTATINIAFGTKIENYMLFTQYVTYVLLGYIIGGLHAEDNGREKKAIDNITNRGGVQLGLWLFASVIKIIIQYAAVMRCGEGSALILGDRIFTMIQALSVFCLFKKYMDSIHVGRLAKSISRCSFGIYLIHPFFINLLYKMVDITPTNFPLLGIGFAIPLLWFIVFLLSWGGTFIMLKVPGINSLL